MTRFRCPGCRAPLQWLTAEDLFCTGRHGPFFEFVWTYFIRCGEEAIKIGKCYGLIENRLADLQVGNPVELRLHAAVLGHHATEKEWHAAFQDSRIRGEWFSVSERLLRTISERGAPSDLICYEPSAAFRRMDSKKRNRLLAEQTRDIDRAIQKMP